MAGIFNGPARGGTRGGQDQFNWENVKADVDREYYLGHSVKALAGRWQKNKDVYWYTREVEGGGEGAREREMAMVRQREEDLMAEALGLKPKAPKALPAAPRLDKADMQRLMAVGEEEAELPGGGVTEGEKADRMKGLGFTASRTTGAVQSGEAHETMAGVGQLQPGGGGAGPAPSAAAGGGRGGYAGGPVALGLGHGPSLTADEIRALKRRAKKEERKQAKRAKKELKRKKKKARKDKSKRSASPTTSGSGGGSSSEDEGGRPAAQPQRDAGPRAQHGLSPRPGLGGPPADGLRQRQQQQQRREASPLRGRGRERAAEPAAPDRAPQGRSARSPPRRRNDSRSPPRRRNNSRSPPRRRHDSRSPPRRRHDSRSPPRRRHDSRSPPRRRHDSPPRRQA